MLHGPTSVVSINHKIYCLVVTDDYSRFSWVFFLSTKDETSGILKTFIIGIENQINHKVKIIRCDNGAEFKNNDINQLCGMKGIKRDISVARTPQQNGVVKIKNMTRIEAARTMLADSLLLTIFWAEAVMTAGNQINKNAGIKDNVDAVPTQQYILLPLLYDSPQSSEDAVADDAGKKTKEKPTNEGERNGQEKEGRASNKEGYATSTNRVSTVRPSVSAVGQSFNNVDDLPTDPLMPDLEDTDDLLNTSIFSGAYNDENKGAKADLNNLETTMNVSPIPTTRIHKDHPKDQIIGDINSATQTRRMTKISEEHALIYLMVSGPLEPDGSLETRKLREELLLETRQDWWHKMDVKSAFLYGTIEEEVYVCQPPGFEDPQFPNKVYKEEKDLYGLHQAPRAWYETLLTYLLENGFRRGTIDKTLFIKKYKGDILLVQVYVDDIIFGSTKKYLCVEFEQMMHKRFQISSIGEITFFLGLQVKQKDDGIFISQDKYVADILKKFDFPTVKTTSTPIETNKALLEDEEAKDVDVHLYRSMIGSLMYLTTSRPDIMFVVCACARDSPFDLEAFSYSDYAGSSLDRKSTTRGFGAAGRKFSLTISPTIYASYIEQFWATAKSKIVNNETQIHAKVDGKTIVISESSVRSNLYFNDDDGVTSLTNSKILENLALMRYEIIQTPRQAKRGRDTKIPQSGGPPEKVGDEVVHKELGDRVERASTTAASLDAESERVPTPSYDLPLLGGNTPGSDEERLEHQNDLMDFVPPTPHDSPLLGGRTPGSDEGRPNINELMAIYTNLSNRVLALETSKTAQVLVINKFKKKVKRLEKKQRARCNTPIFHI
ncbi:putative ribonuclease H-like domain-containing protein [Tanacetum coccineum]